MNEGINARVAALVEEIRSRRFRGEDPMITVAAGASPAELVACVLAAERLNAALSLPEGTYNPQESLAATLFEGAARTLNRWGFREARRRLDDAARRAREPALQQRVTLFLAFCALLQDIVRLDPERPLSRSHREHLAQTLPRLDCLSDEERAHYAAEVERLYALREQIKSDAYARTLWHLVRARMAMDASEEDYGLTWLLAAGAAAKEVFVPGEYPQGLLERGRRKVLLLLGEVPEDAVEAARGEAAGLRLGEVLDAFAAGLDAATGKSSRQGMEAFGVQVHQDGEGEVDAVG
ncbi:MAG: hypothetical protein HY321_01765 [Armatimonadetes bacterium]|nr:hypothetical protein [Armatimonadota bacterium]